MSKTYGIVCEGPTDFEMLTAVIDVITEDSDNEYLRLQPIDSMVGPLGNGWKGVWKWCEEYGPDLERYLKLATPEIDILIIQIDCDVSRKEKEVHCACAATDCDSKELNHPLSCNICSSGKCPVVLPCSAHEESVFSHINYLRKSVFRWLSQKEEDNPKIIVTIPCDSTDAWIVAAYENDLESYEAIFDPWSNIIAKGAKYHGIRIPGKKKNLRIYKALTEVVCLEWKKVLELCSEAAYLNEEIKKRIQP